MSRHYDKQHKLRRSFSEQVENVFNNAERFRWSHLDVNAAMMKLRTSTEWKQLTWNSATYLEGKVDMLRNLMERRIIPAYYIEGKYLVIGSEEYRRISPQTVHEKYSDKCAHVWRDAQQKPYSGYGESLHINEAGQ